MDFFFWYLFSIPWTSQPLGHFTVSCFISLDAELEGLWKRRAFWQNEPNEQPQSFPEPSAGIAAASADVHVSGAAGSCSDNPVSGQRSSFAGPWSSAPAALRPTPVNLIKLLLPNCSLVQRVVSCHHAFVGKVLPAQRCFTARGDIWVWHKRRLPLLVHEKDVSLFPFRRRGVSKPANGTLLSGWARS